MKYIIQSVKGTREFYPDEMAVRNWLLQNIKAVSALYGYQEYDGPFIESIDLYAAKSGEELVKEQAFVFKDRGGKLVTLRPELTPSLARMVAQRQHQLDYPLRWWSFGPFWRYEKPQKGRSREFFQWNIDLVGIDSPMADAEIISICAEFFRMIGLLPSEVKVLVNDRILMDTAIQSSGISLDMKKNVLNLIDKIDKFESRAWEEYALEQGLSSVQLDKLIHVLHDEDLYKQSTTLTSVMELLDAHGVGDYIQFDAKVVRGLDYYTGVVFEARDVGENARAILGGGHYDNLVEDIGGDPLAGVGFAMGDVVLPILVEEMGKMPGFAISPAQVIVTVFDDEMLNDSVLIAKRLRDAGIRTQVYPQTAKLGKQFKFAGKYAIPYAIVYGPDEAEKGIVQLKNLQTREQEIVLIDGMVERIKGRVLKNK